MPQACNAGSSQSSHQVTQNPAGRTSQLKGGRHMYHSCKTQRAFMQAHIDYKRHKELFAKACCHVPTPPTFSKAIQPPLVE
jgi:hypothetical protein